MRVYMHNKCARASRGRRAVTAASRDRTRGSLGRIATLANRLFSPPSSPTSSARGWHRGADNGWVAIQRDWCTEMSDRIFNSTSLDSSLSLAENFIRPPPYSTSRIEIPIRSNKYAYLFAISKLNLQEASRFRMSQRRKVFAKREKRRRCTKFRVKQLLHSVLQKCAFRD